MPVPWIIITRDSRIHRIVTAISSFQISCSCFPFLFLPISLRRFVIVIATGFIPLLPPKIVWSMWESRQFALTLPQTSPAFYVSGVYIVVKHWEKEEMARSEQFLIFSQCFLPFYRTLCHFHQIQNCRRQTLLVWKSPNFVFWESVKEYCGERW